MQKKWARDAAAQSLPDLEVVQKSKKPSGSTIRTPEKPQKPGASIQALRRKYLGNEVARGTNAADDRSARGVECDDDDDDDDKNVEVVRVRSKTSAADPADDLGERTLIVSKKNGIIGSRG